MVSTFTNSDSKLNTRNTFNEDGEPIFKVSYTSYGSYKISRASTDSTDTVFSSGHLDNESSTKENTNVNISPLLRPAANFMLFGIPSSSRNGGVFSSLIQQNDHGSSIESRYFG